MGRWAITVPKKYPAQDKAIKKIVQSEPWKIHTWSNWKKKFLHDVTMKKNYCSEKLSISPLPRPLRHPPKPPTQKYNVQILLQACLQIVDVPLKHYFPTSWVAFLSKLVASKIKPFNSDHDKIFSSCFFDLSCRFLLKSSPFSGGREYGDDRPEKARKEPVNLGSSIGGIFCIHQQNFTKTVRLLSVRPPFFSLA